MAQVAMNPQGKEGFGEVDLQLPVVLAANVRGTRVDYYYIS